VTEAVVPFVDPARQDALQRRRRRDLTIAGTSTALFLVAVAVLLVRSPGWSVVKDAFFNPEAARRVLPELVDAFWLTVRLFLTAEVAILVVAMLIAVLRGLRSPVFTPLRLLAVVYTDIVRGIPTILLIYLFGFGIPALNLQGLPDSELFWGWAALVVSYSAYVAEVFRAGIESVHPSQRAAARSLGLRQAQSLRFVVLPQAVRRVVPPLLNDFISLQKDTALVSVLGPVELLRAAQIDASFNFNFTAYVMAAIFFIMLTIPMARFTDWVSDRMRSRQQGSGAML
jgi:polar amino acid transport system permease protein